MLWQFNLFPCLSYIANDLFTLTDLQFVADTTFLKDNGFLPMFCAI